MKIRNILVSPKFGDVFKGVGLRSDSRAADRRNTEQGGAYFAVKDGTATTDRGAHLGLINDPSKDGEEADSQAQRDKVLTGIDRPSTPGLCLVARSS